jgi:hypothetical protein
VPVVTSVNRPAIYMTWTGVFIPAVKYRISLPSASLTSFFFISFFLSVCLSFSFCFIRNSILLILVDVRFTVHSASSPFKVFDICGVKQDRLFGIKSDLSQNIKQFFK